MKRTGSSSLVAVLLFWATPAFAGDFKEYPGAKIDSKLTEQANAMGAKAATGGKIQVPTASIYVTDDSFEKVVAFYKGIGKEYQLPSVAGNRNKLPSGKELKSAFFIFDGAKDMMTSKQWARIQRPLIGMDMKEGPDRTYIVLSEKK